LVRAVGGLQPSTPKNSFGAFRLLFAVLVILSHSPELIDGNRSRELLTNAFGTLSFGEFAVDGFFLISGYLVTKSFEASSSAGEYLLKRVLRIYPAFVLAYALCIALGPFVGGQLEELPIYLTSKNMVLLTPPEMPGVFSGTPYPLLNGAMWTIAYEFRCYLLVLIFGALGLLSRRWLLSLLTVSALVLTAAHSEMWGWFPPRIMPYLGNPEASVTFAGIFGCGALFYLCRGRIRYDWRLAVLAACGLIALMFVPRLAQAAVAILGGYLLFWAVFNLKSPTLARIGHKVDISYGTYLYAWPVQKVLIWLNPAISPWLLFVGATAAASGFGYASWRLIEKPFLSLKRGLTQASLDRGLTQTSNLTATIN
jgi:peptidoglycan/LPS O-acetylase OafA/YrhL